MAVRAVQRQPVSGLHTEGAEGFSAPVSEGDPASETLRMMVRHNVEMAVVRVADDATGQPILQHPDRFMGSVPDRRVARFGLREPCG